MDGQAPALTIGERWRLVKYWRSATVSNRGELDAALARAPRFVLVEGTEALRAYAASLSHRGGQEAALVEATRSDAMAQQAGVPTTMMVPAIGRIRDGYRHHEAPVRRRRHGGNRLRLRAGLGTVLIASAGLLAALLVEWLSFPSSDPELIRGPHHAVAPLRGSAPVMLPTHAPVPPPPDFETLIMQAAIPILAMLAAAALVYLAWQASAPGKPSRITWRVDHRVQGRLVIARIRTRTA